MRRLLLITALFGAVIAITSGVWGIVAFVTGLGLALVTKRTEIDVCI